MKHAILYCAILAATAQVPPDSGAAIGRKWKQNADALREYSHQRRTEIRVKGEVKGTRVELIRYVDGEKETVPLETPAQSAGPARGGGLRGRMVQKKREQMRDEIGRLRQLLESYTAPQSGMRDLLGKAAISRTGSGDDAAIQVVGQGVVTPSDSVILTWSVVHQRPEKIEVRSELDGKPVTVTVDYAQLPNGPFYAARAVISAPKNDLVLNIEEFDYARGGESRQ